MVLERLSVTHRRRGSTARSRSSPVRAAGIGLAIAERLVADGGRVVHHGSQGRGARRGRRVARRSRERDRSWRARPTTPAHQDEAIASDDRGLRADRLPGQQHRHQPGVRPHDRHRPRRGRQDLRRSTCVAAIAWAQKVYHASMEEHGGSDRQRRLGRRAQAGARASASTARRKAALIHVTEELAVELGPDIRVNAVAPAVVKTRFAERAVRGTRGRGRRGVPAEAARRARATSARSWRSCCREDAALDDGPDARRSTAA